MLDGNKPEEALIMSLIDAPEFQRLRRIHQMGVSHFTFQGAECSRFTHCVGAMYVTSLLVDLLAEKTKAIKKLKPLILASALLHDVGHGPFSHVTEKIMSYSHEEWSSRIISGGTEITRILTGFSRDLPEEITAVLKKTYRPYYVCHLISSQLDCDRFDYLLRDSYMTGTAYGLFALKRILASLEIDEDKERIVVSGEKGQTAVEDYLFARYAMYVQVYHHKKNLAVQTHLSKLMQRAAYLKHRGLFLDEPTRKWLYGEPLNVFEYLYLDDVQMTYHIKHWQNSSDPILSDLSSRFINRHLFKAARLPRLNSQELQVLSSKVALLLANQGFDPEYYCSIETSGIRPYDYYRPDTTSPQTNIMVRTETGEVKELSTISPMVQALATGNFESSWLIYPPEADEPLKQLINELSPVQISSVG